MGFTLQRLIEDVANQIRERERFTAVGIAVGHREIPIQLAVGVNYDVDTDTTKSSAFALRQNAARCRVQRRCRL